MSRAKQTKGNKTVIITIISGIVIACILVLLGLNYINSTKQEITISEPSKNTYEDIANVKDNSFQTINVIDQNTSTLCQNKTNEVSASKQSSLEQAVDKLIVMTNED